MPKTKSALINFPGVPASITNLMPDNGMATLAGVLLANNHQTEIFDYATVDTIEKFSKNPYQQELTDILKLITTKLYMAQCPSAKEYDEIKRIEAQIAEFKKNIYSDIYIEIGDYISKNKLDFIGIKLWMGEGFEGSIKIASQIKKHFPKLPIFAGGPQVDIFRQLIFEETDIFDALVFGEGEVSILKIAEYIQGKISISDIPNLIYKSNGKIKETFLKSVADMNELEFPNYEINNYKALRNDNKVLYFFIDESRGCCNSCNFCPHPQKSGRILRSKNGNRIVSEMDYINKLYNTKTFRLSGSNPPLYTLKSLAKSLIRQKKNYTYSGFGHVIKGEFDDFRLLKKSNCTALAFGIESGSQYILNESVNKNIKISNIENTISNCKKAGIQAVTSIIFPAPLETELTKRETMKLLLKLRPSSVLLSLPGVFPNTRWFSSPDIFNIGISTEQKKDIVLKIMKYKPKLTYPPILCDPLPYTVNNKNSFQMAEESSKFLFELQNNGINTQLTDETLIMSQKIGFAPQKFIDLSRDFISSGMIDNLKTLVKSLNASL